MAVKYDLFKVPGLVSVGKRCYSARTVLSGEIDLEEIANIVASRSTVKQSDVLGAWKGMLQVIKEELENGRRVHLDGLCYLNLSAHSHMVRSSTAIRAESVHCKDVVYRTEKGLKKMFSGVKFERSKGNHSSAISGIVIDGLMREHFRYNSYITRKEFARLCKLSSSTAIRKINKLVEAGKLVRPATNPRSGLYFPVPGIYVSAHRGDAPGIR